VTNSKLLIVDGVELPDIQHYGIDVDKDYKTSITLGIRCLKNDISWGSLSKAILLVPEGALYLKILVADTHLIAPDMIYQINLKTRLYDKRDLTHDEFTKLFILGL